MLHEASSLYDALTERTLFLRWSRGATEVGHSALYLPTQAVQRERPSDPQHAIAAEQMNEEFITLFGLDRAHQAVLALPNTPLCMSVDLARTRANGITTILSEGYAMDPAHEGSDAITHAMAHGQLVGLTVIASDPAAAGRWTHKPAFRALIESLYSSTALCPGRSFDHPSVAELEQWCAETFSSGVPKLILKAHGAGGMGNLVLSPYDERTAAITALLAKRPSNAPWIVAEQWIPWVDTFCVSFFLHGSGAPTHVAIAAQLLSGASAGFIGSTSAITLSSREQARIIQLLRPVAATLQADGVRGFIGIDVIRSRAIDAPGALMLPSGMVLRCIEVNPRVNGHNQELLALHRLARRNDRTVADMVHARACITGIPGSCTSRDSVRAYIASILAGVAIPLSDAALPRGTVGFALDTILPGRPTVYDAVFLAGHRTPHVRRQLQGALARLRAAGLLKD